MESREYRTEKQKPDENFEEKKESILFENNEINLSSEKEAVEFSEDHKEKITEVVEAFSRIDPELVKNFNKFKSVNDPDRKFYGIFPANAHIIKGNDDKWGIEFFNAGMDTKKAHRISSTENPNESGFVDNFSGTLAHEITHGGTTAKIFNDRKFNEEFIKEWREKFGWKNIFPAIKSNETGKWEISKQPPEGWGKNKDGKWQKGDYVIMGVEYTTMPEACIGGKNGYSASVDMYEDICDGVASYLLNPSILNKDKRVFIKNKINEYSQKKKRGDT